MEHKFAENMANHVSPGLDLLAKSTPAAFRVQGLGILARLEQAELEHKLVIEKDLLAVFLNREVFLQPCRQDKQRQRVKSINQQQILAGTARHSLRPKERS